jgi:hypothetical protein
LANTYRQKERKKDRQTEPLLAFSLRFVGLVQKSPKQFSKSGWQTPLKTNSLEDELNSSLFSLLLFFPSGVITFLRLSLMVDLFSSVNHFAFLLIVLKFLYSSKFTKAKSLYLLVRVKCVRCLFVVADGLRGKVATKFIVFFSLFLRLISFLPGTQVTIGVKKAS